MGYAPALEVGVSRTRRNEIDYPMENKTENRWIIFGYDMQDGNVFTFIEDTRPDPKKFALQLLEAMFSFDDETQKWYNRAGEDLDELISEYKNGRWGLHAPYDGTLEGAIVEAMPLKDVQGFMV